MFRFCGLHEQQFKGANVEAKSQKENFLPSVDDKHLANVLMLFFQRSLLHLQSLNSFPVSQLQSLTAEI